MKYDPEIYSQNFKAYCSVKRTQTSRELTNQTTKWQANKLINSTEKRTSFEPVIPLPAQEISYLLLNHEVPYRTVGACMEIRDMCVCIHSLLSLALEGGERVSSRSGRSIPQREPHFPLNNGLCVLQSRVESSLPMSGFERSTF